LPNYDISLLQNELPLVAIAGLSDPDHDVAGEAGVRQYVFVEHLNDTLERAEPRRAARVLTSSTRRRMFAAARPGKRPAGPEWRAG